MTTQEALKIKRALITLSEATGVTPKSIGTMFDMFKPEGYKNLVKASKIWNEFEDSDLTKRGKMLGLTITENKQQ